MTHNLLKIGVAMVVGFAMTSGAAMAQEAAAPATAAADNGCELHLWPAERFTARTSGWLSGLGVVGALADAASHAEGDAARRGNMAAALESQGQVEVLAGLDLATELGAKPARVVIHNEPLDRKTVNKVKERRSDSQASCYAELMVTDLLYQKSPIYGRSLKSLFMYRDFGAKKSDPWIYKGWGGNGLKLFPPKEGEDVQAANDELVGVFKADFAEYAKNLRTARTKK